MNLPPALRRRVRDQAGAAPRPTSPRPPRLPAALASPAIAVEFVVPIATVSETNARGHWRGAHRRTKAADKALAAVVAFHGLAGVRLDPPLVVTLTRTGGRKLDTDKATRSVPRAALRVPLRRWRSDRASPRSAS